MLCPGSRPTAVNLSIAEQQLNALAAKEAAAPGATAVSVTQAVIQACHDMLQADVAGNKVRRVQSVETAVPFPCAAHCSDSDR